MAVKGECQGLKKGEFSRTASFKISIYNHPVVNRVTLKVMIHLLYKTKTGHCQEIFANKEDKNDLLLERVVTIDPCLVEKMRYMLVIFWGGLDARAPSVPGSGQGGRDGPRGGMECRLLRLRDR